MSSKRSKKSKTHSDNQDSEGEQVESDGLVEDDFEQDEGSEEIEEVEEYEEKEEEEDFDITEEEGEVDEEEEDEEEEDEEEEFEEEEFEEEEEFSLDQLSQAYARVRKSATGDDAEPDEDDSVGEPPVDDVEDEISDAPVASKRHKKDEPAPTPEIDDDAACPISPESIVESILFVGAPKGAKLTSRKIAGLLRDVSPKEVTKAVKKLNARYESDDSAFRIQSDKGSLKMVLAESLNEFRQEFFGRNKQVRLSQTAIDVMAVVAYNQPVSREQVDKIRAKSSGSILNQLVKRNLLFIEPQQNDKVKRYATTDKFLDFFNLEEIADLPQSHDVSDFDELAD
jgi:segregation and condensation protein B